MNETSKAGEQERAERAIEFCRNNRGSTPGLAATFAAEEVALVVDKAVELCAGIAETAHVVHGDHYAAYSAPSNDGQEIAKVIRDFGKKIHERGGR
jgi:hypothetical protein